MEVSFGERMIEQHSRCSSPSTGTSSPKESFMEKKEREDRKKREERKENEQEMKQGLSAGFDLTRSLCLKKSIKVRFLWVNGGFSKNWNSCSSFAPGLKNCSSKVSRRKTREAKKSLK